MNGIIRDMRDTREKMMNKRFLLRDMSFVQMYYRSGVQSKV